MKSGGQIESWQLNSGEEADWCVESVDALAGWKASYELWSLKNNTKICSVEISLPKKALLPFIKPDLSSVNNGQASLLESGDAKEEPVRPYEHRRKNKEEGQDWQQQDDMDEEEDDMEEEDKEEEDGDYEVEPEGFWESSSFHAKMRELEECIPSVSVPVAISDDLCRAVILDTVIEIEAPHTLDADSGKTNEAELHSQVLNLAGRKPMTPFRSDLNLENLPFEVFCHLKFSPSGEYLVAIRESVGKAWKGPDYYGAIWFMQVFHDQNHAAGGGPHYTCMASTAFFAVPEITILSPCRGVVFHPKQPRLAFPQICDGLPQTYIWDLSVPVTVAVSEGKCSNPFPVHEPPIVDPSFSDDGMYVYGMDSPLEFGSRVVSARSIRRHCTPLICEVPEYVTATASTVSSNAVSRIQTNPLQSPAVAQRIALELSKKPKPAVQKANSLMFDQDEGGIVHISNLQQLEKEGAVVLNTFGANGKFQSNTISRLPKAITHCVDVSLIHSVPGAESDEVKVVLNKAPQKQYRPKDTSDCILPAIIKRQKKSVPTYISTMPLSLGRSLHENEGDIRESGSSPSMAVKDRET